MVVGECFIEDACNEQRLEFGERRFLDLAGLPWRGARVVGYCIVAFGIMTCDSEKHEGSKRPLHDSLPSTSIHVSTDRRYHSISRRSDRSTTQFAASLPTTSSSFLIRLALSSINRLHVNSKQRNPAGTSNHANRTRTSATKPDRLQSPPIWRTSLRRLSTVY